MSRTCFPPNAALRAAAWCALTLAAGSALAQPPQVDGTGWRLVRKYCSNCHEVQPHPSGLRSGVDGAPAFAALALDPVKGTPDHLRSVLAGRHSSMPPHHFSDADVNGLLGYFQALRTQPVPAR
ncbi:MAG: cytochrome c [Nevskia sp.]|nr:cytochrome c [Nevskia sp.]